MPAAASQDEILERLWRESALDGLAASITLGGFFAHEPLLVEPDAGALIVVDGNRRLAVVRLLTDPALRERLGAGGFAGTPAARLEQLQHLPVVVTRREAVWQSLGFRHVSGAQPWRSYGQAAYVAWARDELGIPLDQLARGFGDSGPAVRGLYRALKALQQADRAGVYRVEDRWTTHFPFSSLVGSLDGRGVQGFVGLSDDRVEHPVPEERLQELGELCVWLFGSRSRQKAPVVQVQDSDLRALDEVVQHPRALAALRAGQPLAACLEIVGGERPRFRESVLAARRYLQEAHGNLPPGPSGQPELLGFVDELVVLARSIRDEIAG